MSLLSLPNELILLTASELQEKELSYLLRTCHRFADLLTPLLHRLAAKQLEIHGAAAITRAAEAGHEPLVRLLLREDYDFTSYIEVNKQMHPLIVASIHGHLSTVKTLLGAKNIDIDFIDIWERSAIDHAVSMGHGEVVSLLLKHGAYTKNSNGDETLLHSAIRHRHEAVVDVLLGWGDINAEDDDEMTPLHIAVEGGPSCERIARKLIESGAEVNSQNAFGETALHWAAWYGQEALVKLLLERNVDTDIGDNNSETPLCWAMRRHQGKVVSLLKENNAMEIPMERGHFCCEDDTMLKRGVGGIVVVTEEQILGEYL